LNHQDSPDPQPWLSSSAFPLMLCNIGSRISNWREMVDEDAASGAPVEQSAPLAALPTSAEELQRQGQLLTPLNPNAEHQRRLNEALVRLQETQADQAGDDRNLR
jgi:hypothetical protein